MAEEQATRTVATGGVRANAAKREENSTDHAGGVTAVGCASAMPITATLQSMG
jgi:hypothetical protein